MVSKHLPRVGSASRDYKKENFVLTVYLTSDRVAADENVIAVFIWALYTLRAEFDIVYDRYIV